MIVIHPLNITAISNISLYLNRLEVLIIHKEDSSKIATDEELYKGQFRNQKKFVEVMNEQIYQTTVVKRLTFNLRKAY